VLNNYTWGTADPVNGDQFHQHDDRMYGGGGASRTFDHMCRRRDRSGQKTLRPPRQ
jgi:hypothetical protein